MAIVMKRTGAQAHLFYDSVDYSKTISGNAAGSVTTQPYTFYKVINAGPKAGIDGTDCIPYTYGVFFSPPAGVAQYKLWEGDRLYPIDPKRICKTTASFTMEEGVVEFEDDCGKSSILDGTPKISGSFAGAYQYDDETGKFIGITDDLFSMFAEMRIMDEGGSYSTRERDNIQLELLINVNSDVKVGQNRVYLYTPIVISNLSSSLGLKDPQAHDITWTKGSGDHMFLSIPRFR